MIGKEAFLAAFVKIATLAVKSYEIALELLLGK
jgi:hypothetical protein